VGSAIAPEVTQITLAPALYTTQKPAIVNKTGVNFSKLSGFSQTVATGHTGTIKYQLSKDGTNWFYHNGSNWASASNGLQSNTADEINLAIVNFSEQVGIGSLYFKAFLESNGTQVINLDTVAVIYAD
jgi:hypothetical protein